MDVVGRNRLRCSEGSEGRLTNSCRMQLNKSVPIAPAKYYFEAGYHVQDYHDVGHAVCTLPERMLASDGPVLQL